MFIVRQYRIMKTTFADDIITVFPRVFPDEYCNRMMAASRVRVCSRARIWYSLPLCIDGEACFFLVLHFACSSSFTSSWDIIAFSFDLSNYCIPANCPTI